MLTYLPPCLYAFVACFGFCIVFNFHNWRHSLAACFAGALGWFTYLLFAFTGNDILQFFLATIVLSLFCEWLARFFKAPVTGFLLVALLPLVPGGGIYYTMEYGINGNTARFIETGLHTFGIAGALALGVLVVSSAVRLWGLIRNTRGDKNGQQL